MPTAIMKAVVAGAIIRGWLRFAVVTLITFHGPARIGEALKGRRCDLLLAGDTFGEIAGKAYLHICNPK